MQVDYFIQFSYLFLSDKLIISLSDHNSHHRTALVLQRNFRNQQCIKKIKYRIGACIKGEDLENAQSTAKKYKSQ